MSDKGVPSIDAPVRTVILKTLGVRRVGAWCGVAPETVYQWLSRGSPDQPIPPKHVPAIIAGAAAAGMPVELALLWPAVAAR
jgi:hypothetical protein